MSSMVLKRYGEIEVEWHKGGKFTVTGPYHAGGPDTVRTYFDESDAVNYAKRKYKEKIK